MRDVYGSTVGSCALLEGAGEQRFLQMGNHDSAASVKKVSLQDGAGRREAVLAALVRATGFLDASDDIIDYK